MKTPLHLRRATLKMAAPMLAALWCAAPLSAQELLKPGAASWRASAGQDAAPRLSADGATLQLEAGTASKAAPAVIEQNLGEPRAGLYRFRARLQAASALRVEVRVRLAPRPGTVYGSQIVSLQPNQPSDVSGFALVPDLQNDALFQIVLLQPGALRVLSSSLSRIEEADLSAEEKRALEAQMGPKLPPVDEKKLLAETDARIRKHRTGPLTIRVVDAKGKPLANRKVSVKHLRHIFRFGSDQLKVVFPEKPGESELDRRHREAYLRLFNHSTVQFYWGQYEPQPRQYKHQETLRQIAWLKAHNISPRGHALFWNIVAPGWLNKPPRSDDEIRALMDTRLKQLSQTVFPELTDVDVWNELVQWDRVPGPITDVVNRSGKLEIATRILKEFKRLNPNVGAVVNDFDSTPAAYELLRQLLEMGAPIDIIGQQTHGGLGGGAARFWTLLERLSLLKRPILLSELSVMSGQRKGNGTFGPSTPEGEAKQAEEAETFYRLAYSHPNVTGVVIWNFSDYQSWKKAPRGFLRVDGTPKPSFFRIDNLINKAWRTGGEFTTGADGTVVVPNAFEGEYEITASGATARGTHSASAPLRIEIKDNTP